MIGTYPVGVAPNAIASDPTNKFLYVTDGAANQMIGFLIQLNGTLIDMQTPFKTDNLPNAVQVDPRGIYVYVANYNANDVSAYTIDRATGNATQIAGSTAYAVDAGPICVLIEPAEARYVYTANFLGNTVSGLALNPSTGALSAVQNTPFKAAGTAHLHSRHHPRQPCHRSRAALALIWEGRTLLSGRAGIGANPQTSSCTGVKQSGSLLSAGEMSSGRLERYSSTFSYQVRSAFPGLLACSLFASWMVLSGTYCSAQNGAALPESPSPQPATPQSFFKRLIEFYRQDWHGTAPQGPSPPRRGLPSPLESPPFPNSDWSYGGSPVIGEAGYQ